MKITSAASSQLSFSLSLLPLPVAKLQLPPFVEITADLNSWISVMLKNRFACKQTEDRRSNMKLLECVGAHCTQAHLKNNGNKIKLCEWIKKSRVDASSMKIWLFIINILHENKLIVYVYAVCNTLSHRHYHWVASCRRHCTFGEKQTSPKMLFWLYFLEIKYRW